MKTYKIGNKVNVIIRATAPGKIGDTTITYANQPYTIVYGASASMTFKEKSRDANDSQKRVLGYNNSFVDTITFSDVEVNSKILNLIFSKSETKLAHNVEHYTTNEEKMIFFNTTDKIYQVFIYNDDGVLEQAYGTYDASEPLLLQKPNRDYLIVYSYEAEKSLDLSAPNNTYWILDVEIIGNIDDQTSHMWIHLDKCVLESNKNLYFSHHANAVDLTFRALDGLDVENYITLE